MEFRLIYDGWLPPVSQRDTRNKEKHDIRKVFARQLQVLWETHPTLLRDSRKRHDADAADASGTTTSIGRLSGISGRVMYYRHQGPIVSTRSGRRFIPLITEASGVGCALDILFLRRDQPGALIKSGGDIDNRIKVLFDALKMPANDSEVYGDAKDDPDPFYCLMEDDRLITDVRITTDRLLVPTANGEHLNSVRLVIRVRTVLLDPGNLGALSF